MKISNSKKELARIISENGGWKEYSEWAAQDKSGEFGDNSVVLFEGSDKPEIEAGGTEWMCREGYDSDSYFGKHVCNSNKLVKNWHQTILSREEYFHLYPAPDADGWIEWSGEAKSPVAKGAAVDVKMKNGTEHYDQLLSDACWHDSFGEESTIAYRLHAPEQAKPELCESVMRSIPEPYEQVLANPPTIEQLAADYRSAKDYADSKQQEADVAKDDAEAKLKLLELAGEALGLLVSPITAKQEPELVITDWRELLPDDVIKVHSFGSVYSECTVLALEGNDVFVRNHAGRKYRPDIKNNHWRFIRRP